MVLTGVEFFNGGPIMALCEWNPRLGILALSPPHSQPGDCENEAVLCVGTMGFHLCESCAKDDAFKRLKKIEVLRKPQAKTA
jgi:hypothetical protein